MLGEFGAEVPVLIQMILHLITDHRLGRQLNSCKLAYSFVDTVSINILVVDVLHRKCKRGFCRFRRDMSHLLKLEILDELGPSQEEVRSKLLDVARLCNLDLISPLRLLLAVLCLNL